MVLSTLQTWWSLTSKDLEGQGDCKNNRPYQWRLLYLTFRCAHHKQAIDVFVICGLSTNDAPRAVKLAPSAREAGGRSHSARKTDSTTSPSGSVLARQFWLSPDCPTLYIAIGGQTKSHFDIKNRTKKRPTTHRKLPTKEPAVWRMDKQAGAEEAAGAGPGPNRKPWVPPTCGPSTGESTDK